MAIIAPAAYRRVIARATDRFVPRLLVDAADFRRLWFGQTISVFGDQITQNLKLFARITKVYDGRESRPRTSLPSSAG